MRLPMTESMESRIFTRTGACKISVKLVKVVDWRLAHIYERERERERESSKNIGMAKCFGHFLRCVMII